VTWGRKEKQAKETVESLSLEKRKIEKMHARRKNSPEKKDNNQDELR
jgi:hypothetical protein